MPHSKDLVQQVAQDLENSATTSPTAAGPTENSPPGDEHIDAINQVFALFRLNYHNQFYAAYPDSEQLNQVKRLWFEALSDYPVSQILRGARHALETSEYLPTLNKMLDCCHQALGEYGLPDARSAFVEACQAGSPKSAQAWSHPAVYLAGRDSDWFFLANNIESVTWPVFRTRYQAWCNRVLAGEKLEIPEPEALPEPHSELSSKEDALAELARIKNTLEG